MEGESRTIDYLSIIEQMINLLLKEPKTGSSLNRETLERVVSAFAKPATPKEKDFIPTPEDLGFISPLKYIVSHIREHNWTKSTCLVVERKPHIVRDLTEVELISLSNKGWFCKQHETHFVISPVDC